MATDLTNEATNGFNNDGADCPHLYSSPAWYAWKAGEFIRSHDGGCFKPTAARMGRGYSVRLSTADSFGMTENVLVKFDKNDKPTLA